jgi:hypothetical protein
VIYDPSSDSLSSEKQVGSSEMSSNAPAVANNGNEMMIAYKGYSSNNIYYKIYRWVEHSPLVSSISLSSPLDNYHSITASVTASDVDGNLNSCSINLDGSTYSMTNSGSTWSKNFGILSAGSHSVTVTCTDSGGKSASSSRSFSVLDAEDPPTIDSFSISSPRDNHHSIIISVTASDANGNLDYCEANLDGSTYSMTNSGSTWSKDFGVLSLGPHSAGVTCYDTAGKSDSASESFTVVDVEIPEVDLTISPSPAKDGHIVTFTITATTAYGDITSCELKIDGVSIPIQSDGDNWIIYASFYTLKTYLAEASCFTSLGKSKTVSESFQVIHQDDPPEVDFIVPVWGQEGSEVPILFNVTDDYGLDVCDIRVKISGQTVWSNSTQANGLRKISGSILATFDYAEDDNGNIYDTYNWEFECRDTGGNTPVSKTSSIKIYQVYPVLLKSGSLQGIPFEGHPYVSDTYGNPNMYYERYMVKFPWYDPLQYPDSHDYSLCELTAFRPQSIQDTGQADYSKDGYIFYCEKYSPASDIIHWFSPFLIEMEWLSFYFIKDQEYPGFETWDSFACVNPRLLHHPMLVNDLYLSTFTNQNQPLCLPNPATYAAPYECNGRPCINITHLLEITGVYDALASLAPPTPSPTTGLSIEELNAAALRYAYGASSSSDFPQGGSANPPLDTFQKAYWDPAKVSKSERTNNNPIKVYLHTYWTDQANGEINEISHKRFPNLNADYTSEAEAKDTYIEESNGDKIKLQRCAAEVFIPELNNHEGLTVIFDWIDPVSTSCWWGIHYTQIDMYDFDWDNKLDAITSSINYEAIKRDIDNLNNYDPNMVIMQSVVSFMIGNYFDGSKIGTALKFIDYIVMLMEIHDAIENEDYVALAAIGFEEGLTTQLSGKPYLIPESATDLSQVSFSSQPANKRSDGIRLFSDEYLPILINILQNNRRSENSLSFESPPSGPVDESVQDPLAQSDAIDYSVKKITNVNYFLEHLAESGELDGYASQEVQVAALSSPSDELPLLSAHATDGTYIRKNPVTGEIESTIENAKYIEDTENGLVSIIVPVGVDVTFNVQSEEQFTTKDFAVGYIQEQGETQVENHFGVIQEGVTNDYTSTIDETGQVTTKETPNNLPTLTVDDIIVYEGETIYIDPIVSDPDGDSISLTFSGKMNSDTWETGFDDSGVYTVTVGASDGSSLITQDLTMTVLNVNRPPVLELIPDITVKESEHIRIIPIAYDPDNDDNVLAFSFSYPLDEEGKWQTDYSSAGTYLVNVTVSDGNLNETQEVKIVVEDVHWRPVAVGGSSSAISDSVTEIVEEAFEEMREGITKEITVEIKKLKEELAQDILDRVYEGLDAKIEEKLEGFEMNEERKTFMPEGSDKKHTTISKKFTNTQPETLKDIVIVEEIPKEVAQFASELEFKDTEHLIIIQEDPVVAWKYDEIQPGETKEIGYTVNKEVEVETDNIYVVSTVVEEFRAEPEEPESGELSVLESSEIQGAMVYSGPSLIHIYVGFASVIAILVAIYFFHNHSVPFSQPDISFKFTPNSRRNGHKKVNTDKVADEFLKIISTLPESVKQDWKELT